MPALVHDCCFERSASAVHFETARAAAVALAAPLERHEEVVLEAALGRTLALPVRAPRSLPPFDQAAMDGYALHAGAADGSPRTLSVVGCTKAGDGASELALGTAHRILTGAALPRGADAVVMEEHATRNGDRVRIGADAAPGLHVRRAGEDVAAGAVVLPAGRTIGWPEIALLAALGLRRVTVAGALRIVILTTGSELRTFGAVLSPGAIYDSNGPMLAALLAGPDVRITALTVRDDAAATAQALDRAAATADLIVTTAGMSVSEEDHVRDAMTRIGGNLSICKVAMKPGKPLGLGRLRNACFLGLPGNPQAAACGALAFARPMIDRLLGRPAAQRLTASTAFSHTAKPGRTELLPVTLAARKGRLIARRCGTDGSHRLMPMVSADAMAIVPDAQTPVGVGTLVEILPFDRLRFGAEACAPAQELSRIA